MSIDGASAEVFEDIRAGARFASFVENVTDLARRRAGSARTRVSGWSVLTRRNLHEAPAIVRLARAMNITTLTFQPFLTHWGKDDMRARIDPVRIDPSDPAVKAVLDEALRVAQEEGVALRVGKDAPFSRESPCTWPWLSAYITSTGDVVPCCLLADADTMKMGNLFETPFREIWRGEPYQTLRRQIANNAPPRSCRGCYGEASTRQETLVQIKARP